MVGFSGNKGAVGVSFMFNGTSFGFVNCHLTSGNEKIARYHSPTHDTQTSCMTVLLQSLNVFHPVIRVTSDLCRRNQNYLDILRLLSLGDKQLNSFDISLRFTHLFWLGDLNYRLDMDIQVIQKTHTHTQGDKMQQF